MIQFSIPFFLLFSLFLSAPNNVTSQEKLSVDEFINNPFPHDFSHENFDYLGRRLDTRRVTVMNARQPGVTDTIYRMNFRRSKIYIQHNIHGKSIRVADVRNRQVEFAEGIRVGMSREELQDIFVWFPENDHKIVSVQNRFRTSRAVFFFNNRGRLTRLKVEMLY